MKKLFSIVLISTYIYAVDYKGCGQTEFDARQELSSSILISINSDLSVNKKISKDNYSKNVVLKSSQKSHLQLSNIKIKESKNTICAYANKKDQIKYTNILKKDLLQYNILLLPKKTSVQLSIVENILIKLNNFNNLKNAFTVKISDEESIKIQKLTKSILDKRAYLLNLLKDATWKTCEESKKESLNKLDKLMFDNKISKSKEKTKWYNPFSSSLDNKDLKINILKQFIKHDYDEKTKEYCTYIIKKDILKELNYMYTKVQWYKKQNLPKEQSKQIKVLNNWIEQIRIIDYLIYLFPDDFNGSHKTYLLTKTKELNKLKNAVVPQYIKFITDTGTEARIKIDKQYDIKSNKILYIKKGKHNYVANIKEYCPITDEFKVLRTENKVIILSFKNNNLPIVRFNSNKIDAKIIIEGKKYKVSKEYKFDKCSKSINYTISYKNQIFSGTINLKTNDNIVKEFYFLTVLELKTFNNKKALQLDVKKDIEYQGSLSDEDIITDTLSFEISDSPSHGKVDLDKSGSYIYTPNKGYRGADSFKYKVITKMKTSPNKLVNIKITGSNNIPIALTNMITLTQGDNFSDKLKAKDKDDDKLIFRLVEMTKHGKIEISESGDFKYIPNKVFYGKDTFIYEVSDEYDGKSSKEVIITVVKNNNKPTAKNKNITLKLNQSKDFKILFNDKDGDKLKFTMTQDVENGSITCSSLGICKYIPIKDFSGKDMFKYIVNDGIDNSKEATVSIEVIGEIKKINNAPTSENMTVNLISGIKKEFKLIANDKESDKLIFKVTKEIKHGSLDCSISGICTYKSLKGFIGDDKFEFEVTDINGAKSDTSIVIINVQADKDININKNKKNIKKEMKEDDYQEFKGFLLKLFKSGDEKTAQMMQDKYPNSFNRFMTEMQGE